ncbi:hypothetical protein AK812_SmicGene46895, partial [Symbiodinium microadriaticum]
MQASSAAQQPFVSLDMLPSRLAQSHRQCSTSSFVMAAVQEVQLRPAFWGEQAVYGPHYRGGLAPPPDWCARELYVRNMDSKGGSPTLPIGRKLARILKGVFGLSDAPREWFLRLRKSLTKESWKASTMDAATFFLWSTDATPRLLGMLCSHVDDLLFAGGPEAWASLERLGAELGFGSTERDSFTYCGKKVSQNLETGEIQISMKEYHENLQPIRIAASRRRDMDAVLHPGEAKQLRALVGSLQWLVAQCRIDMGYQLSVLQADSGTVATALRANTLVKLFKATADFSLSFKPLDLSEAGILVVTDASLGNVTKKGNVGDKPLERVFSQSVYCVLLAERSLLNGSTGRFCVLDYRSHRLQRVCRSTFAAELLGMEEGLDAGQYCRGHWAEALGYELGHKNVESILDLVPLVAVTDAKDVFDKGTSDTPSYGSQKSLALTIAWLRGLLARCNVGLKWTATENLFVDCGTKDMDSSHMRETLSKGEWSFRYNPAFVKQTVRARVPKKAGPEVLTGSEVKADDPVLGFLQGLSTQKGWHRKDGMAIQVSHGAKSFRRPEPRFNPQDYPLRTTYGLFHDPYGKGVWRILERDQSYGRALRSLDREAAALITIFRKTERLWESS